MLKQARMFELNQEEILMYSDDRTVTLTSHRIIQHTSDRRIQMMLEDFINYEKKPHIGNYKGITIGFTIITLLFVIPRFNEYFEYKDQGFFEFMWESPEIKILIFFLSISIFFLLISRRYMIRINGKYNCIEFRVRSLRKASLKKFLGTLDLQSNKIKSQSR